MKKITRRQFGYGVTAVTLAACGVEPTTDSSPLIAPDAQLTRLASGFFFTEGPAADSNGNIYFSDIFRSRIYRWSINGGLSTFRNNTGGANGLMFDRNGNLLACEGRARRVTSTTPRGRVSVLAQSYNGRKLNSPNDLWIDPKGGVYFTDPRSGDKSNVEQDGFHVYYILPSRDRILRVIGNLVFPNGVIGTADGQRLYVSDANRSATYSYRINEDGSLSNRRLAARVGSDGITLDAQGNLYVTGDQVLIYNQRGRQIGAVSLPEKPSNVTFGGPENRTLFITAMSGLYALQMDVRGQQVA